MPAKKQTAPAKKKASPPIMGIVEYPDDPAKGQFYVLLPALPDTFIPAIHCAVGALVRPCFIRISSTGDDGMRFAVGWAKQVSQLYELRGFQAALQVMGSVWGAVLDANRPLTSGRVQRLAQDLATRPEASRALISQSGILNKKGGFKSADDYVKTILALCYWKLALGTYKGRQPHRKFTMFPSKGGRSWAYSAKRLNRICDRVFPRSQGWEWQDFTAASLKSFYNNRELFPPDGD